jgi:hypothetical protein
MLPDHPRDDCRQLVRAHSGHRPDHGQSATSAQDQDMALRKLNPHMTFSGVD